MPGKKFTVAIVLTHADTPVFAKATSMQKAFWSALEQTAEEFQYNWMDAAEQTFLSAKRAISRKPFVHSVGLAHESGLFSIQIERV